jgi:solute carrier family 31 (copper transporter), member 1
MMRDCAFFLFHNVLGYALMLLVMLYNGYVFIAVVFGMTLGYFLFGHIAMKVNMENIQAVQTKAMCSPQCPDAGECSY